VSAPITVVCHDCRGDDNQPVTSPQNCELCAEDWVDGHRRNTGHTDIELRVTQSFTADDVRSRLRARRAWWAAKRAGF
jgi:hypothetical protein